MSPVEVSVQYVVIYMKVSEDKEGGMVFNGPFYGPIENSESKAKSEAHKLSNSTRSGAVVSKVVPIPDRQPFTDAMDKMRPIFERIKKDMVEAKEIADRPVVKRKKKKKP
jgi:hypothetical protein